MDQLPQISLGTAALIIFAVCAGYMIFRGLARTLVNTAMFALCAWIGFRVWQHTPNMALDWTGKTHPLITTGLPVLAFFASLFVIRKLVGFFRAPMPGVAEDNVPRSSSQLVFRLIFALIPAVIICLVGATLLHHAGSVAEVREAARSGTTDSPTAPNFIQRIKTSIDAAIPDSMLDLLDPFTSEAHLALAKWIASDSEEPLPVVIDPATGKPYPRAIIVEDPALRELARDGHYSALLRHPLVTEALKDPQVRKAIGH